MIWQLWILLGRLAYWISWPLLYVYIYGSRRTRVLVVCGEEVLVVRGWLGDGRWLLPGGGVHRKEPPAVGAQRELKEETGIEVHATELQKLLFDTPIRQRGLPFRLYAFSVELKTKPNLKRQKIEITDLAWKKWQELRDEQPNDTDIRHVLEAFYKE